MVQLSKYLVALFFLVVAIGAHAAGPIIQSIEVQGNKRIEDSAVAGKIASLKGTVLDEKVVEQDIRSIFRLGYFDHIEVLKETVSGGVKLIYRVVEKPIISKIEYEGFDSIDKDDREDAVKVKVFEVLDIHRLNLSVEKLNEKYEEKGFYLADVRYDIEVAKDADQAVVTFKASENDKVQVKEVNIIGNEAISDAELKAIMQTREGGALSWLSGSGTYREEVFERDLATLAFYYGTQGYVQAKFGKPQVTVSPDKRYISISFGLEEGEKYLVGKVDFRGDLLYSRDELEDDLQLVEGETFNTDTLRRETLRYTEKYSDLGYAFANVVPQPRINPESKTVDLTFDIDKGKRVYVGRITMVGNTRTKDKVIRRQLTLLEGELFNGTKKRESRENVIRLGYFDSVEFNQTSSKDDPQVVDIEVRVKERSTGQLVIGAGYSAGQVGFTFNAQLSQNNFLGNGQVASLSADVQTGRNYYNFNLSFTEPFFGYSLWSVGGDLYHQRRDLAALRGVNTFEETKSGFRFRLGHPVYHFTNLFLTYKLENSFVPEASIIDTQLIPPSSVNGVTSSMAANIVYDKRNDRFDPREGLFASLTGEVAGLGGNRKFVKSRAQFKYFHPLFWELVFRMNVTGANITAFGGSTVPVNELYILGGLFSLRGYDLLSVGPKARLSSEVTNLSQAAAAANLAGSDIVIGGTNEVMMNMEVEFPLLTEARIRGVIFADVGNVFNTLEGLSPGVLFNVGWGIRWFTPIGPLRFEFGYPIVNPGEPKFFFTIGPPF